MMKVFIRRFLMALCAIFLISCSDNNVDPVDYAKGINDIPDLAGKCVSVYAGSIQDVELAKLDPQPDLKRFNSIPEMIVAVASGQADYCIVDSINYIGADIESKGMQFAFNSRQLDGFTAMGLRYDEQSLCNEFNEFLARFSADGRLAELKDRWTKGDVSKVVMPDIPLNPNGEVLTVGTSSCFPFDFIQDGEFAGFEIELVLRFAAETGRNVEFQLIDFSGLIAALVSGKIDVILADLFITEERSKQILFSDSYYRCGSACACRANQPVAKSKPFFSSLKQGFYDNLIVENRWHIVVKGLLETLVISFFSILLGTIFGGFVCWMRRSRNKLLNGIAKVYVEIIRGVPILVLLMLMFYVIFAQSDVSARWVAIIAFSMNFGAYVSEMFRTGIDGVDKGQTEAGLAMGFTPFKTFFFFVVPQAAKTVIPVFKGEAISLIKNTSVVGFIAIQDLTKASEIIRARTFDAFFPLIVISIIYFILAWLFGKLLDSLAKKLA